MESGPGPDAPSVGSDQRIYAIGDIHGRADLFAQLLDMIGADNGARDHLPSQIILLGDLIDRGPHSRQVIEGAMRMAHSDAPIRFLKGNHEEVFVAAARGDSQALRFFCRIGGRETILSYGLEEEDYDRMDIRALSDWVMHAIPRDHVDFIDGFEDMIEAGDYLFVHAGIRPDVPLADQKPRDLRWIRQKFLHHKAHHGKVVVHGHTITGDVDEQVNRIGIDTGAYRSGMLTAIGLEGVDRWYLSTGA